MSEIRKDPILSRWVIISKGRGKRPIDYEYISNLNKDEYCPFCPGNEESTPPEIYSISEDDSKQWALRVVPNKFPALHIEGDLTRSGEGLYDKINGIGAHEVIIETNDHNLQMTDYEQSHLEHIIKTYRLRINDLKNDTRLKYVIIFKNYGPLAGASLEHAHSQLVALPIIPQIIVEELEGSKKYFDYKERCIYCDIINQESKAVKRIVIENEYYITIEPFAACFPFETWILPKKHNSNFETLTDQEIPYLANILTNTLKKISAALNCPSYNFVIHSAPLQGSSLQHYHWHIEIIPKITHTAGFEWGTGFHINPIPPEEAAQYLRDLTL
jgi:UDPglucose--hexose-1-phosphate uridylyltransferase